MRHRKAGKRLSRKREERVALQRNLALGLFRQFGEDKEFIRTTHVKARWVKSFIEKCITIGIKGFKELQAAADAEGCTIAELREKHHGGTKVRQFSPKVRDHLMKALHFRRLAVSRLRSQESVKILFDSIAPRYLSRPGGYLRVLKTNKHNLGDGAPISVLAFVEGEEAAASA